MTTSDRERELQDIVSVQLSNYTRRTINNNLSLEKQMTQEEMNEIATIMYRMLRADEQWLIQVIDRVEHGINYDTIADSAAMQMCRSELAREILDEGTAMNDWFISSIAQHHRVRDYISRSMQTQVYQYLSSQECKDEIKDVVDRVALNASNEATERALVKIANAIKEASDV